MVAIVKELFPNKVESLVKELRKKIAESEAKGEAVTLDDCPEDVYDGLKLRVKILKQMGKINSNEYESFKKYMGASPEEFNKKPIEVRMTMKNIQEHLNKNMFVIEISTGD